MLITSSRKPSAGTRTLCKHLASFFGCEYFNRGKMSMEEVLEASHDIPLIVIGEYHGNPGSMLFYDSEGECVLSFYITVLSAPVSYPKAHGAIITGDNKFVPLISEVLLPIGHDEASNPLILDISEDRMDFKEKEEVLFNLKIRSYKVFIGDEA